MTPTTSMDSSKTSRKSHTKARTGCRVCKRRKIKCGEERPACKNCVKHAVECDFSTSHLWQVFPRTESRTPANEISSSNTPQPSPWPLRNDEVVPHLALLDLELLHNYSTWSCYTLSSRNPMRTLWRVTVPQLGFKHSFVMRGILAISALHLAHAKPGKRDHYFEQAASHHEAALEVAMPMLSNLTEDNCAALYIFSIQIVFFALASPRKPGDFLLLQDSGIPDWLFLFRGTRSIIHMAGETLENGILSPIYAAGKRRAALHYHSETKNEQLLELRTWINETVDSRLGEVYATCIDELERSFAVSSNLSSEEYELTDAFIWPFILSDEFLQLLKQHASEALVIFAHFCVLLKKLDGHWWMQGWGTHIISQIYSVLDEEHRLWIQWPIEQVGWIPDR